MIIIKIIKNNNIKKIILIKIIIGLYSAVNANLALLNSAWLNAHDQSIYSGGLNKIKSGQSVGQVCVI